MANLTADQLSGIGITLPPDQLAQLQSLVSTNSGSSLTGGTTGNQIGQIGGLNNQNGMNTQIGPNVGTGQLALGGLQTLGNLWTAWNAEQLAQQSFNFNKTLASDNYTNQAQSYNTKLTDTANTRAAMENQTQGQAQNYINANQLKTTV